MVCLRCAGYRQFATFFAWTTVVLLALVVVLSLSCGAVGRPDRWTVGVTRAQGEINGGGKPEGYDTEEYALEVAVHGAIGSPGPERIIIYREASPPVAAPGPLLPPPKTDPEPPVQPAAILPEDETEIPWVEIGTAVAGALALYGGQKGHKHYQGYRAKRAKRA